MAFHKVDQGIKKDALELLQQGWVMGDVVGVLGVDQSEMFLTPSCWYS
jgi:hypothetical protein